MARSDDLETFLAARHSRKRKRLRRLRRRRVGVAFGTLAAGFVALVAIVGFGAGAALSSTCSLSSLRAVNIGANSFVYAADGSLLGSIPAERNREPRRYPCVGGTVAVVGAHADAAGLH